MRRVIVALGLVVGLIGLVFGGIGVLSEINEVVVLTTTDAAGNAHETRLWIVDDVGRAWLRAGSPQARWYGQLVASADVTVVRDDVSADFRAVPVSEARGRINELMAAKYGSADRILALIADRGDSVPIRLDPR